MDKRPTLRLLPGGADQATLAGDVCRSTGCASTSVELGYCATCLASYHAKRPLNAHRYAVLVSEAAQRFYFGTLDPFVHDLLAAEFVNAVASEDRVTATLLMDPTGF